MKLMASLIHAMKYNRSIHIACFISMATMIAATPTMVVRINAPAAGDILCVSSRYYDKKFSMLAFLHMLMMHATQPYI
jgi:hypothetical protein